MSDPHVLGIYNRLALLFILPFRGPRRPQTSLDALVDFLATITDYAYPNRVGQVRSTFQSLSEATRKRDCGAQRHRSRIDFPHVCRKRQGPYFLNSFFLFSRLTITEAACPTSFSYDHNHPSAKTPIYAFTISTTVSELFYSSDAALLQHERNRFSLAIEPNRRHTVRHHLDAF